MQTKRSPIVTILGHVDHGKTSILDTLRKSRVQLGEAGGITQSIGASSLKTKSASITFIDTPGHAAFREMRSRGARIADIALLVVAADDGVKPQTKEALDYIQKSGSKLIVVFNKIDLPSANVQKAMGELEELGVLFEGRGGDIPYVETSVKEGRGFKDLLEIIELVADVEGFEGDSEGELKATVIETNKDKRGLTVSAVIQNGSLKIGDQIAVGSMKTKIRGLFDEQNKPIREAGPSDPVLILGFSELPQIGQTIVSVDKADPIQEGSQIKKISKEVLENELGLVIKAASAGCLEAILAGLPEKTVVLNSGVGAVTESDIFFAKTSGAIILTFELKLTSSARKLSETEEVPVFEFDIIYDLFQKVEELIQKKQTEVKAEAKVLAMFPFNKLTVAGCKVKSGEIRKGDRIIAKRDEKEIGQGRIISLKRGKEDLEIAKAGEECGIIFKPQFDFIVGDVILSVNLPE